MRGFSEIFRGFSKVLSEPLSECHFPLRVAGRVAPNRVSPQNSYKSFGCDGKSVAIAILFAISRGEKSVPIVREKQRGGGKTQGRGDIP